MITLSNVSKSFQDKQVLKEISFEIREGEVVCILGKSGSGKTTLLNILAGLLKCDGEIKALPSRVSYVFQEPRLIPTLTVAGNLKYIGASEKEINENLKILGIEALKNNYPRTLSGGEKQRVSLARAFSYESDLILLDEPFSSLDTKLKVNLSSAFVKLMSDHPKKSAVYVTHDLEEALMVANRILLLRGGKIASVFVNRETGTPNGYLDENPLRKIILNELLNES